MRDSNPIFPPWKGGVTTIRPIGHIPELCRKGIWRPRIYGNSLSTDHVSFASALMRRGTEGLRTLNLLLARQALSQLELRPHILLQIKNHWTLSKKSSGYGSTNPIFMRFFHIFLGCLFRFYADRFKRLYTEPLDVVCNFLLLGVNAIVLAHSGLISAMRFHPYW